MLSLEHEAVRLLFRNRPALAAEVVANILGTPLPAYSDARLGATDLTEARPAAWHADLVIELRGDGVTRAALVVEVQRAIDPRKRFSWPLYVTSVRASLECQVVLLVVATDPAVARWARQPIEIGPGARVTPLVLGFDAVPAVEELDDAARDPELAVLSALAHVGSEREREVALATLRAVTALVDEDRRNEYVSIVFAAVSPAVGRWLEAQMTQFTGTSDYERRLAARAGARAVIIVLEARGITVTENARTTITACRDQATVDRWLERAGKAETLDDVLMD